MSGVSNFFAAKILGWMTGSAMGTAPTHLYVGLNNGNPTDAGGGGTDVTTTINSGGRIEVDFGSVSGKAMASNADCDFGTADAGATITHFTVWDAQSGGNMLGSQPLATSRTVATSDPVKFASGDIVIGFS